MEELPEMMRGMQKQGLPDMEEDTSTEPQGSHQDKMKKAVDLLKQAIALLTSSNSN